MPESADAETRFQSDAVRADTLAHYPVSSARFDEMYSAPGTVRPHWQYARKVRCRTTGNTPCARSMRLALRS